MKPLEIKGKALKKTVTLYEADIKKLDILMKKYDSDASEIIRQLISNQYDFEFKELELKEG